MPYTALSIGLICAFFCLNRSSGRFATHPLCLTRTPWPGPLLPDTVLHVVALSTEHRLMSHPEALELVEVMVGRCAEFHKHLGVDAVLPTAGRR